MKIAVAYDNGEIFLHFGHCRYFAVYTTNQDGTEVETKKLVESEVARWTPVLKGAASQASNL